MRRAALITAVLGCLIAPAQAGAAKAPLVRQLVAFRSGEVKEKLVRASATRVRVGRRRCAAARGTPLAALARSKPGKLGLKDFGSCTRDPADGGQLFVRSIAGERNRLQDGWVYKVGRRLATAGAADPSGPFGRGRLRSGQRVTWFYGRKRGGSFQRTLELTATQRGAGGVAVRVRGYDDHGRGAVIEGAKVAFRGGSAITDASGVAVLPLIPGAYRLRASKKGLVPSFAERIVVR